MVVAVVDGVLSPPAWVYQLWRSGRGRSGGRFPLLNDFSGAAVSVKRACMPT